MFRILILLICAHWVNCKAVNPEGKDFLKDLLGMLNKEAAGADESKTWVGREDAPDRAEWEKQASGGYGSGGSGAAEPTLKICLDVDNKIMAEKGSTIYGYLKDIIDQVNEIFLDGGVTLMGQNFKFKLVYYQDAGHVNLKDYGRPSDLDGTNYAYWSKFSNWQTYYHCDLAFLLAESTSWFRKAEVSGVATTGSVCSRFSFGLVRVKFPLDRSKNVKHLVSTMAHELGHTLGSRHINDEAAIQTSFPGDQSVSDVCDGTCDVGAGCIMDPRSSETPMKFGTCGTAMMEAWVNSLPAADMCWND